jgi:TRAP-type C4-dicarboxylate transport system permease small subunit
MTTVFTWLRKATRATESLLLMVSGLILGSLVFMGFAEIASRTFFNKSHDAWEEVLTVGTLIAAFLASASAARGKRHIRIEILYSYLSDKKKQIIDVIECWSVIVVGSMLGIWLLGYSWFSFEAGFAYDSSLRTPHWIPVLGIAVGMLLSVAISVDQLTSDRTTTAAEVRPEEMTYE